MSYRTKLHNFPDQPTSFVGREPEIAELVALLAKSDCRLLTLVGPGGIGKTRLSLEVAAQQVEDFVHGTYFVPLAPLKSATNIVTTVINALGIQVSDDGSPREELVKFLTGRNLLMILDNFEHVLEGADLVAEMTMATPECKFLVTSRQSLNLQLEWVWHVKGLPFPKGETDRVDIEKYNAIGLFIDRARQVRRDFSLDDEKRDVLEICQLVGGYPLAIELAATRVKTLPCAAIIAEIQRSLSFLADPRQDVPERHRSIRAVFDWSWQLLSPEEREIFPRLSVFRGGFTYEAAEAVVGASVSVLSQLVERSLLQRLPSGRYDVHELLRQFGEAELMAHDKADEVQVAHSAFFAAFMHERSIDIKGRRQREGLDDIEADLENLRAVWERAVTQRDYATLDRMIEGFYWFRNFRGLYRDVFQYAWERLAPDEGEEAHPTAIKMFVRINEYRQESIVAIERAREMTNKYEDADEVAFYLLLKSRYLIDQTTHIVEGRHLLEERLAHFREDDNDLYVAEYYYAIGDALVHEGKSDLAVEFLDESYNLHVKTSNLILAAWPLNTMGQIALIKHQYADAEKYYFQALDLWHKAGGYAHGESITLSSLSWLVIKQNQFDRAMTFAQEAMQIALNHNYVHKVGAAHDKMVWIAFLKENYSQAANIHKTYFSFLKLSPWPWLPIANGEWQGSLIAWGLQRFDDVRQSVERALHYWTVESSEPDKIIQCLPVYAAILANDGQYGRATELLALALTHPTNADGWMATWPLLIDLRNDLYDALGDAIFESAWERGQTLDLNAIVSELLDKPEVAKNTLQLKANRDLSEPLSPRELEVLRCLGDRLTNQEIADELIISVGTVKSHTNKIYAKLSVKNRTEAVKRARELNLM